MYDSIKSSIIHEGDKPDRNIIDSLVTYSNTLNGKPPDLIKTFNLFMPHLDPIRKEDVFICSNIQQNKSFNVKHIASDYRILDLQRIQEIINDFYLTPTIVKAFELYIKFELIHPFTDGNGRVGRFIFFEHALKFYLSSHLLKKTVSDLHRSLFKSYSKKIRIVIRDNEIYEYRTGRKYQYKQYYDVEIDAVTSAVIENIIKITMF